MSNDLNGKQAASWSKADLSQLSQHVSPHDSIELLKRIKDIVSTQVKLLCADKNDDMYRSIVDLIMLRVNMVLQSTSMSYADVVSVDDMSPQVCKCLSDTFTEKYADMRFISIKLAADEIVKLVKDAIVQQCNAASTSQDVREAEDIMLVSSVHDAPGEEDESLQTYAVQDQDKAKQQQNQPDESSENIAFASISTYVDVHMSKLAELCVGSINYTQLRAGVEAVAMQQPAASSKKNKKYAQSISNKKGFVLSSANVVQKNEDVGEDVHDSMTQRLPDSVTSSNIYKFSGSLFQGMQMNSAMLSFSVLASFEERIEVTMSCICTMQQHVCTCLDALEQSLKDIYNSLPKSLLERIHNFIKDNLHDKVIKPLKDRMTDFYGHFVKDKMEHIIGICKQAYGPIIQNFLSQISVRGQTIAQGLFAIGKLLFKAAKLAYKIFRLAFKGVMTLLKFTLKTAFKTLTTALTFAAKALAAIFKFIGRGLKLIGDLFSKTPVGKFIGRLWGKVKSAFSKIAKSFQKIGQKIGNVFSKMKNALKRGLNKLKGAIKNGLKKVGKAIKNVIRKVATKIFNVVKNVIKKTAQKIMKKLGLTIARKIAKKQAQSLLKIGAKKILGFFRKWVMKLITKYATKLAGAAAANVVPILGQIVSAALMIYTIVDTIVMFYQIYKFMKENPEAWEFVKEQVAKWAAKAFNFIDDMLKRGKQLFHKVFVEGPKRLAKAVAHYYNFVLNPISAAKKMLKNAAYSKELEDIREKNLSALGAMDEAQKADFLKDNTKSMLAKVDSLRPDAEKFTQLIEKEQSSWWPDNKKIVGWLDQRQAIYRQMMEFASKIGLHSFAPDVCKDAFDVVDAYEKKKQAAEQQAARISALALRYENKRIDIESLQKICKGLQDKTDAIQSGIDELDAIVEQQSTSMVAMLEQLQDEQPDNEDRNFVIAG